MRTIQKFEIPVRPRFTLEMPDAEVLSVKVQPNKSLANDDKVVMWAAVDTNAEQTKRQFQLFMTGNTLPPVYSEWSKYKYLDSFTLMDKEYHLFEEVLNPRHSCRS